MLGKPKIAMYWASSCGGCEISLANTGETLLDIDENFDFFFCPCLVDGKRADVEACEDDEILITLFNGGIRTDEQAEMAELLRRKSRLMVAFGSCAQEGCVPGLGNLTTGSDMQRYVYDEVPSMDNPDGVRPQLRHEVPEGTLTLPTILEHLSPLDKVVDIDYYMPGCPPEPHQITAVVNLLISGAPLPPKGSVIGAGTSTVCDECPKRREAKKISELKRAHEFLPDPDGCLLDQGQICMGVATRSGCGGLCPKVNSSCIGCYGPPEGVVDQGAKMASVLGSVIDIDALKPLDEADMAAAVDKVLDSIPDYAGTFYKFSLAHSSLAKKRADV